MGRLAPVLHALRHKGLPLVVTQRPFTEAGTTVFGAQETGVAADFSVSVGALGWPQRGSQAIPQAGGGARETRRRSPRRLCSMAKPWG
jgi:hypothetical protein